MSFQLGPFIKYSFSNVLWIGKYVSITIYATILGFLNFYDSVLFSRHFSAQNPPKIDRIQLEILDFPSTSRHSKSLTTWSLATNLISRNICARSLYQRCHLEFSYGWRQRLSSCSRINDLDFLACYSLVKSKIYI